MTNDVCDGLAGDAVRCDQAIEALSKIRCLLGVDSAESFHRSASSEVLYRQATDGAKSGKGTQPMFSNSQPPGQTGSFDSANSQDQQWPEAADSKAHQQPSTAAIKRAPPPPTHAELAEHKPGQSCLSEEAVHSASSTMSAQAKQQEDPATASSAWGLEYSQDATLLRCSPASRYSTLDIPRRHTTQEESPPIPDKPRRHSSEEQRRLSDWTGQQLSASQRDTSGRHLSSFTHSQVYALQAHDRGRQGQGQEPQRSTHPRPASSQRSIAEVDLPSHTPRSTSRRDDQDERYSSRGSSIEVLEGLNCPIVEYNQLQIKRKIGDGSIGLVSQPQPILTASCTLAKPFGDLSANINCLICTVMQHFKVLRPSVLVMSQVVCLLIQSLHLLSCLPFLEIAILVA